MNSDESAKRRYQGSFTDENAMRIEDSENSDAWLEADYRDGWVERKLLTDDDSAYEEMVNPYYQQCIHCREWQNLDCWGVDSPYCPGCEQFMEYMFPRLMAWVCDGESLEREEVEI